MSITRNSVYVITAQLSLLFSGAVINFGLGRFLGPSLYGQFGIVYAIATILNLLLVSGVMQAVSKYSSSQKQYARELAGGILKKQLILSILIAPVFYFLAIPIAFALRDPDLASLIQILTPLVIIYSVSAVYAGYITGIGKFGRQATQLIMFSVSRLIATFVLAFFFSIAGAVAALPLAALIALIYFVFASRIKPRSYNTLEIYKFALPITIFVSLITIFLNVDLFLIKIIEQNNTLTGFYTAAGAVARIPYLILTALGIIMLPTIAQLLAAKKSVKTFAQEAFRYVLIILLPSTLVMSVTGKPLVMLLYRSEYAAAGLPLSILALGTIALTLSYLFAIVINAAGRPALTAAIAAGMVALSISLNLVLIPAYHLVGAAIATTLTSFLSMIILFFIVYQKIGLPINLFSLLRVTVASAVLFIITLQVDIQDKFVLIILYPALAVLYVILLLLMKELKKSDFKRLFDLLPNRFNVFL